MKSKRFKIIIACLFGTLISTLFVLGIIANNAQADTTRTVTVKKLIVKVYNDDAATAAPMPDSDYTISYVNTDGTKVQVAKGVTDNTGTINNVTLTNIPDNVAELKVGYTLGTTNRGYIQKYSTDKPYQLTFTKSIPETNIISFSTSARFGNSSGADSFVQNYLAARFNNFYVQAVNELTNAILAAHEEIPSIHIFEMKPINMYFERGVNVDKSNAFYRNGHNGNGIPDIGLADRTDLSRFSDYYMMHNVMHEWTHWNLYRTANLPSGSYTSKYSYNTDFRISYKEGAASFAGNMFAYAYDMKSADTEVQNDNFDGINRLYGKSTIKTVEQVLYDLLDVNSMGEDEDFYVVSRYLENDNLSEKQIDEINFGIIYAEMMQSKVNTLSSFLQYIQNKYVINSADTKKFGKILTINGLSPDGDFTLDEDGNALTRK